MKPGLKEFLSACVNKFNVYISSLAMKRNFLKHLAIIAKEIGVLLPSSKILDQTFCFRNCHFLLVKPDKPIFHKNLKDFFHFFPSTTFENTLLIDDMPLTRLCLILLVVPFFLDILRVYSNYLLRVILSYLESLHSSKMWVYKFVGLNPFGSIIDMPLGDPWYEK